MFRWPHLIGARLHNCTSYSRTQRVSPGLSTATKSYVYFILVRYIFAQYETLEKYLRNIFNVLFLFANFPVCVLGMLFLIWFFCFVFIVLLVMWTIFVYCYCCDVKIVIASVFVTSLPVCLFVSIFQMVKAMYYTLPTKNNKSTFEVLYYIFYILKLWFSILIDILSTKTKISKINIFY